MAPRRPPRVLNRPLTGESGHASFKTALESIFQREVSSSDVDIGLELRDVTRQAPPATCLLIDMLPPEMHYEILSHLDYWDHRQLKNTSHFFRDRYITEQYHDKSRQRYSKTLLDREIDDKLGTQTRLPCYRCLRLRRKSLFPHATISIPQHMTAANTTVVPGRIAERTCTDCLWAGVARGKPVTIRGAQWTKCYICGRHKTIHAYDRDHSVHFCHLCGFLLADRRDCIFILIDFVFPVVLLVWLIMDSVQGRLPAVYRKKIQGTIISAFLLQMIKFYYICSKGKRFNIAYTTVLSNESLIYAWTLTTWLITVAVALAALPSGALHEPEFAGIKTLLILFLSCAMANMCLPPILGLLFIQISDFRRRRR